MKRQIVAIIATSSFLSGCAAMNGAPDPVISVAMADAIVAKEPPDTVMREMEAMTPDERTLERNRVIEDYVLDADAKYEQFKSRLSWQTKGGDLGLDVATLTLTGVASVWGKAAKGLSAAATGVGGARASIDKEVYFDKTLPAIVALMDSSRQEVHAEILTGEKKAETDYTINAAFADVMRYQEAGSIDSAIQKISDAAGQQAQAAQVDYSKAVKLCTVPASVATDRRTIMITLDNLVDATKRAPAEVSAGRSVIQQAAIAAGIPNAALTTDAAGTSQQLEQISDYLLSLCSAAPVASFKQTLSKQGVKFDG